MNPCPSSSCSLQLSQSAPGYGESCLPLSVRAYQRLKPHLRKEAKAWIRPQFRRNGSPLDFFVGLIVPDLRRSALALYKEGGPPLDAMLEPPALRKLDRGLVKQVRGVMSTLAVIMKQLTDARPGESFYVACSLCLLPADWPRRTRHAERHCPKCGGHELKSVGLAGLRARCVGAALKLIHPPL